MFKGKSRRMNFPPLLKFIASKITFRGTALGVGLAFTAQALAFDAAEKFPSALRDAWHYCEGCHDGVLAVAAGRVHSVGVDYRLAQLKSRGKLRDISQLDPAIRLDNGRVGCLSCHSESSDLKAKLISTNEGSRLCFACHDL